MKTPLGLAILFSAIALISFADESASKERQEQLFRKFDTNYDGSVSLEEYKAGMVGRMAPGQVASVFQQKDRDRDGKLSMEELLAGTTEKEDSAK